MYYSAWVYQRHRHVCCSSALVVRQPSSNYTVRYLLWLWGQSQQPGNNHPYKDGKKPSSGSRLESIIAFQDLLFHQWCNLVIFPKGYIGPRVGVKQRRLRVLQRWGQLFYLAQTGILCMSLLAWCECQSMSDYFSLLHRWASALMDIYRADYWLCGSTCSIGSA